MGNPVQEISTKATDTIGEIVATQFWNYGPFISGIVLGLIIAYLYHSLVGRRTIVTSYERLLKEKDKRVDAYKMIISERLEKVTVPPGGSNEIIKRLKKFFKQSHNQ